MHAILEFCQGCMENPVDNAFMVLLDHGRRCACSTGVSVLCTNRPVTSISFFTVQPHSNLGQHRALGGVFWDLLITVACRPDGP